MNIQSLFPIIVPRRYRASGKWVGPIQDLFHPDLCVTWVELTENSGMSYLSHDTALELEAQGVDFVGVAFENLRLASRDRLWTHEKLKRTCPLFCAAMHEDGLGTSRLLLVDEWKLAMPGGFMFGIPERSCAVVVPNSTRGRDREEALEIIAGCYKDGCTKMLPSLHDPELFRMEIHRADG